MGRSPTGGRIAPLPRPRTPHVQDEVSAIIRGRGAFFHDGQRDPFGPGDLLFVAAVTEHRFEDSTEDLAAGSLGQGTNALGRGRATSVDFPRSQCPRFPSRRGS